MPFPNFVNDLNEIPGDLEKMASKQYKLLTDPSEAPPTIRKRSLAFISIYTKSDNRLVGCFVPDLYELAQINGLKVQVEEQEWATQFALDNDRQATDPEKQQRFPDLYYIEMNGTIRRRTSFDLATLRVRYSDYEQNSEIPIIMRVQTEFAFRKQRGKALPPRNEKYSIESDYLRDLGRLELKAEGSRDPTINILNPGSQTTPFERALHYVTQRLSLIIIIATAMAALGSTTPLMIPLGMVCTILSEWCLKEFGVFDSAEFVLNESSWLTTPEFSLGTEISDKKLFKTILLMAAIMTGVAGAAYGGWALIMELGIPALNFFGFSLHLHGFVAALTSLTLGFGALNSAMAAQRFFWGLSIYNKQINFDKDVEAQKSANVFVPLDPLQTPNQVRAAVLDPAPVLVPQMQNTIQNDQQVQLNTAQNAPVPTVQSQPQSQLDLQPESQPKLKKLATAM